MTFDRAAALRNAGNLLRQRKVEAAIEEYLRIVEHDPRDWSTANTLGDLYVRADRRDKAIEQFTRIADTFLADGFLSRAWAVYKKVLKLDPDHEHALLQIAHMAAAKGMRAEARGCLTAVAARRRAGGDLAGVAEIAIRLSALDPDDLAARLGAASARAEAGDRAGAAADLRLVATELDRQGRQADAIQALRSAVAWDPDDRETRARLLRAYVAAGDFARARTCAETADELQTLAGVLDTAGQVKEALDVLRQAARSAPDDADLRARLGLALAACGEPHAAESMANEAAVASTDEAGRADARDVPPLAMDAAGLDTDAIFAVGVEEPAGLPGPEAAADFDVSLPVVPDPIARTVTFEPPVARRQEAPAVEFSRDLEEVFAHFRAEAAHGDTDVAETQLELGLSLCRSGLLDDGMRALEIASRSPRHRFRAATHLGCRHRDRGNFGEAIDWFEHAAEVQAPTVEAGHALLYDLADVLERAGEAARALAIWLELQTEAGDYRDVGLRLEKLAKG